MNILSYRNRKPEIKVGKEIAFTVIQERVETRVVPVVTVGYDEKTDSLTIRAAQLGEQPSGNFCYNETVFEQTSMSGVVMAVDRRQRIAFVIASGAAYVVPFDDVQEVHP